MELLLSQPVCVDPKGYRDKAMLEVMYATGARVTELIDLNVSDVNLEQRTVKCSSAKKSRFVLFIRWRSRHFPIICRRFVRA